MYWEFCGVNRRMEGDRHRLSDLYGRVQLDVRMYFSDRDLQPVNARSIVMRDKKIWAGE